MDKFKILISIVCLAMAIVLIIIGLFRTSLPPAEDLRAGPILDRMYNK